MKLQEFLVESIRRSALEVFSTMLASEIGPGEFSLETGMPPANDGVVSFIGIAGPWAGTGSVSCSPVMACRICSQMLMTESTAVDEEVLDAVAELTNMVIGNVKSDLESQLGPLGLSVPTVVYGRNFKARSAGPAEWIVVRFSWDEEVLTVRMCLAPTEKVQGPPHAFGAHCALEA